MASRIIEQMLDVVRRADSSKPIDPGSRTTPSPDLYVCSTCDDTYITYDMSSCPNCNEPVELTPSFSDLGIGTEDEIPSMNGS